MLNNRNGYFSISHAVQYLSDKYIVDFTHFRQYQQKLNLAIFVDWIPRVCTGVPNKLPAGCIVTVFYVSISEWKKNFLKIKKLVLIGGPDDGVITPWQSRWVRPLVFSLLIRHMFSCHNLSYRQKVFTIILYIYCTCDFVGKKSEIVQSEQGDFNTFSLFVSKNQSVINAFKCVKTFLPHTHLRHIVARCWLVLKCHWKSRVYIELFIHFCTHWLINKYSLLQLQMWLQSLFFPPSVM